MSVLWNNHKFQIFSTIIVRQSELSLKKFAPVIAQILLKCTAIRRWHYPNLTSRIISQQK